MDPEESDANGAASSTAADATAEGDSSTPSDDKPLSEIASDIAQAADKKAKKDGVEDPSTLEPGEDETADGDQEEPATEGESKEEDDEVEDPEGKGEELPPFHKHPRFVEVVKKAKDAEEMVAALKPKAESAEQLTSFCQRNNVTNEDLQGALEMVALMKMNPTEFNQRLRQMVDDIDVASGTRLPADLQKKVDDAVIDLETAREVAQNRLRVRQSESQVRNTSQRSAEQHQASIENALTSWEESQRKTDTSYANRRPMLEERLHYLWGQNPPQNVQDAIRLAEQANKDVKERVAKLQPKKAVRKPLLSRGSSANNGEVLKIDNLSTDLAAVVNAVAARHR